MCWRCRWRYVWAGRAKRASTAISTSNGGSRARMAWRRARSAGRRLGLDADLRLENHHRRSMGDPDLGDDVVPARLIGVMEQLQYAVQNRGNAGAERRRQCENHGAGRSRLSSMDEGRPSSSPKSPSTDHHKREDHHHDANRYFSPAISPTASRKPPGRSATSASKHRAARHAFQGSGPVCPADHQGQMREDPRDVPRSQSAICCISGYTNIIHPDKPSASGGWAISRRSSRMRNISARPM